MSALLPDQIEANKLVRRGLYAYWDAHPTTQMLAALRETADLRAGSSCLPRRSVAAAGSAYGHDLDLLHVVGLGRALPSVRAQS